VLIASKLALFLVSGLKDEMLIKKQTYRKLKHANSILETFEYFCQMSSKSITIILSYTVSKLVHFLDTVYTLPKSTYNRLQFRQIVAIFGMLSHWAGWSATAGLSCLTLLTYIDVHYFFSKCFLHALVVLLTGIL